MGKSVQSLVKRIKDSKKYRPLCEDTIRDVVSRELAKNRTEKQALDASRRKLHLILAAYLGQPDHKECEIALRKAFDAHSDMQVRNACIRILSKHASCSERQSFLDSYYSRIFRVTGRPQSVVDLACAYHPFGLRWMDLAEGAHYRAYDINRDIVELVNLYFRMERISGKAELRDVLVNPPEEPADIAFLFKMYHCLEHRRKGAGLQVVDQAPASWIALSFPSQNLRARSVAILENYQDILFRRAEERKWTVERLDFKTEVLLLIKKGVQIGYPTNLASTPCSF